MCSCLRTFSWVVVTGSAVAITGGLSVSSCRSSAEQAAETSLPLPEPSPADTGGESGAAETAAPAPSAASDEASALQATATAEARDVAPPQAATGTATPIGVNTKRTAAGLPDELPGYLSWHRLAIDDRLAGFYVYFPPGAEPDMKTIESPAPPGTIVLAERKRETDDFIRTILVATRQAEDWSFATFAREQSGEPFSPADPQAARTALEGVVESPLQLATN